MNTRRYTARKSSTNQTEGDVPDYSRYYDGRGVTVSDNGEINRDVYGIGLETGMIEGGGCFPANPLDPSSPCLVETGSDGVQRTVIKERERWVFRVSYIDPTVGGAPEVNVGFAGAWGYAGDDELVWVHSTSEGRRCFTFYSYYCNTYGIDLDYITASARLFLPSCALKFGSGYKMQIFYQSSRYKITDTIPPGANEWEPATIPATATRLEQPGKELWVSHFKMLPAKGALRLEGSLFLSPEVEARTVAGFPTSQSNTGSSTYPTVKAGETDLRVVAEDCGQPFQTTFLFTSQPVAGTSGHKHAGTGGIVEAPAGKIANVPSFVAGQTGTDGESQPMHIVAGRYGGTIKISLHADSVGGVPMNSEAIFGVGFPWFRQFVPTTDDFDLKVSGGANGALMHPIGMAHYGVPELFEMVRLLPMVFRLNVTATAKRLQVNDMSLPLGGHFDLNGQWADEKPDGKAYSHVTHRLGFDADFDKYYTDFYGVLHTMSPIDRDNWRKAVVKSEIGRYLDETPIHFRLNEDVIDSYMETLK